MSNNHDIELKSISIEREDDIFAEFELLESTPEDFLIIKWKEIKEKIEDWKSQRSESREFEFMSKEIDQICSDVTKHDPNTKKTKKLFSDLRLLYSVYKSKRAPIKMLANEIFINGEKLISKKSLGKQDEIRLQQKYILSVEEQRDLLFENLNKIVGSILNFDVKNHNLDARVLEKKYYISYYLNPTIIQKINNSEMLDEKELIETFVCLQKNKHTYLSFLDVLKAAFFSENQKILFLNRFALMLAQKFGIIELLNYRPSEAEFKWLAGMRRFHFGVDSALLFEQIDLRRDEGIKGILSLPMVEILLSTTSLKLTVDLGWLVNFREGDGALKQSFVKCFDTGDANFVNALQFIFSKKNHDSHEEMLNAKKFVVLSYCVLKNFINLGYFEEDWSHFIQSLLEKRQFYCGLFFNFEDGGSPRVFLEEFNALFSILTPRYAKILRGMLFETKNKMFSMAYKDLPVDLIEKRVDFLESDEFLQRIEAGMMTWQEVIEWVKGSREEPNQRIEILNYPCIKRAVLERKLYWSDIFKLDLNDEQWKQLDPEGDFSKFLECQAEPFNIDMLRKRHAIWWKLIDQEKIITREQGIILLIKKHGFSSPLNSLVQSSQGHKLAWLANGVDVEKFVQSIRESGIQLSDPREKQVERSKSPDSSTNFFEEQNRKRRQQGQDSDFEKGNDSQNLDRKSNFDM